MVAFMLFPLLQFRGEGTPYAFVGAEECLGRAEGEEHVETNGDVVLVVGDVETDELLVLAVLMLNEREDQTAELLLRALDLEGLLATVFQP